MKTAVELIADALERVARDMGAAAVAVANDIEAGDYELVKQVQRFEDLRAAAKHVCRRWHMTESPTLQEAIRQLAREAMTPIPERVQLIDGAGELVTEEQYSRIVRRTGDLLDAGVRVLTKTGVGDFVAMVDLEPYLTRLQDELAAAERERDDALEGAVLTEEQIADIRLRLEGAKEHARDDESGYHQGRVRAYRNVLRMVGALESTAHDLSADAREELDGDAPFGDTTATADGSLQLEHVLALEQSAAIERAERAGRVLAASAEPVPGIGPSVAEPSPWTVLVRRRLAQAEDTLGLIEHEVHAVTGNLIEDRGQGIGGIALEQVRFLLEQVGPFFRHPVAEKDRPRFDIAGDALVALAARDVIEERCRQDERWGDVKKRDMGTLARLGFNTGRLAHRLEMVITGSEDADDMERYARSLLESDAEDGSVTIADIFLEELAEVMAAPPEQLRGELVQAAAVLHFAIESLDYERTKA